MPLGEICSNCTEVVFFIHPQVLDGPGKNVFRYDGSASGRMFYNWNRDYNPALGRYVQSDPIGLGGGINTYVYSNASPILQFDFFGLTGGIGTAAGGAIAPRAPVVNPSRECMQEELEDEYGPAGSLLVTELSPFSLFPNASNIDGTPLQSAGESAAGGYAKYRAYKYLTTLGDALTDSVAHAMHGLSEAALPAMVVAAGVNAHISDKCTCEATSNPNGRSIAHDYKNQEKFYDNTYRPSTSLGF